MPWTQKIGAFQFEEGRKVDDKRKHMCFRLIRLFDTGPPAIYCYACARLRIKWVKKEKKRSLT